MAPANRTLPARRLRRRGAAALALLACFGLLGSHLAQAAAPAELSARVDRAVAGSLGEKEEEALLGDFAAASVELADLYDRWVRTGAASDRTAAAALGAKLLPPLERLRAHHQGRIDRAQAKIIAEDGNPEVLYEERWWQLDRGFALAAAGQLAWLHYRMAMLHPEKKEQRREWLTKSVDEFSEFVAAQEAGMRLESFLGRAMAEGALGQRDEAQADLNMVLEAGRSHPLYWPARLALVEIKAGVGTSAGLDETRRLLADAQGSSVSAETLNQVRLMRLELLVKTGGDASIREAASIATQLSKAGPAWSRRVTDTVVAHMKDPRPVLGASASAEWIAAENLAAEEKFEQAIKAYEAIVRSNDPAVAERAVEARHRLGICYFRLGRFADAERELGQYLALAPAGALAPEASYLRFRAAETLYREEPTPESRAALLTAVESFVTGFPDHESHHEGAFRLAELLQHDARYLEAAGWYAKVEGPPAFRVRAAAQELASVADALAKNEGLDAARTAELRTRIASVYDRFEKLAAAHPAEAPASLRARVTVARALADTTGPEPRYADALGVLDGFETRHADVPELHLSAAALRLTAARELGRIDDAERAAAQALAAAKGDPASFDLLERLARSLIDASADAEVAEPETARRFSALAGKLLDGLQKAGAPTPDDLKADLARVYVEEGRLDEAAKLYDELLAAAPKSRTALRRAALLASERKDMAAVADYWGRLAKLQEVATPDWYEARLAAAEGLLGSGRADEACRSVREVDEFRPDLRDAATRTRFRDIGARACAQPS